MTERDQSTQLDHWSFDKRIPIALILTLLTQGGLGIWWASGTDKRLDALEKSETRATVSAPVQADRLTRVEVKLESVQEGITEIKRLIQARP